MFVHPEKVGPTCVPGLGGTWSCLLDVMRTQLVQQVTERPAGTHMKRQLTETSFRFFHQSYPDIPFHTVADTWIDSFQVH